MMAATLVSNCTNQWCQKMLAVVQLTTMLCKFKIVLIAGEESSMHFYQQSWLERI